MSSERARSIVYAGHEFAPYTTAEATLAPAVSHVEALGEPGGAALHVVSISPAAREVRVKLLLDLDGAADAERLAEIRLEMSAWLAPARGAELVLPGGGNVALRDAVPTGSTGWDSLFREDGSCEITFTAYDPRAWGADATAESGEEGVSVTITREGTARVPPRITFYADAGAGCTVALAGGGSVEIEREMAADERVTVDCANERVWVANQAADDCVTVGSDFFDLPAGDSQVSVEGGHALSVSWREAWL